MIQYSSENDLLAFTEYVFISDQFESGGKHKKHTIATWSLGAISEFV
jgi:hypothetical protein